MDLIIQIIKCIAFINAILYQHRASFVYIPSTIDNHQIFIIKTRFVNKLLHTRIV